MTRRGSTESKPIWQVLLIASAFVFAGTAHAQDDAAESEESASLEKIAVTGSRIKRNELEGPANIIVIDQQQMAERGYTTVYEALSDLTINNGFKFEGAEAALFTPDVQTINLRGFGVGNTLTLVNGRRLANYPAAYQSNATVFSYGSIPIAAIDRIEILTTGASAIYGSDAVAGVVNIILRNDVEGTVVNALWGTPTETKSNRRDLRLQLLNGDTYSRGSYTFTVEYLNRDSIRGSDYSQFDDQKEDYPFGTGVYDRTLLTLDNFKSAFGVFPRYRDPTEITGLGPTLACGGTSSDTYTSRAGAGNFCTNTGSGAPAINFQNAKESVSAYFGGTLEIGDNGMELFADVLYYDSKSSSYSNSVFVFEDILDLTKPDTVDFGFFDWYSFQRAFTSEEMGFDPTERYKDTSWTVMSGVRGTFADLHDWEFSANFSTYDYESERSWFKWREVIDTFLGSYLGVGFFGANWWSGGTLGEDIGFGLGLPENLYGPVNDAVRNAVGLQSYSNTSDDMFLTFNVSGDLFELSAGPVSYAAVFEYEDTDLKYIPDALLQQSAPTTDSEGVPLGISLVGSGWYNLTGYSGDGDRQRWSAGGELRIPVVPTVIVNLAARYDDYDSSSTSFGSDVTPSASIEWRPLGNLLLRAGYTESFRAPDMAQVFVRTGFFTAAFDYINCLDTYKFQNGGSDVGFDTGDCDTTTIFAERVGSQDVGLPALDAETGDSYWVGFSWDIIENLNLTVDYTDMTLEQRVAQQSTQGILNDEYSCLIGDQPSTVSCDQVDNQVIRGVDPTTGISFINDFFVTSINRRTEKGSFFDVKLSYNLNTEMGDFVFQADYNNVVDHTLQIDADSDVINLRDDPVNGGFDFRASFVGSLGWSYRDFGTVLTGVYRGGTARFNCTSANGGCVGNETGEDYLETGNYRVDSYTVFNWTGTYNWTDQFLTRLRVQNLLDEKPPRDDTHEFFDQPWYNIYVYPGAGIGRYAALELEYSF